MRRIRKTTPFPIFESLFTSHIDDAHNGLPDLTAFQKVEASDTIGSNSGSRKPRYDAAGSITGKPLGWENATSGPNEVNPDSGGRRCSHGGRIWHCSKCFLREPDLALEEARSGLRCCKNQTLERACSCHIEVAVLAPNMAAKVQIRNQRM
jgi:hypothetical protein